MGQGSACPREQGLFQLNSEPQTPTREVGKLDFFHTSYVRDSPGK